MSNDAPIFIESKTFMLAISKGEVTIPTKNPKAVRVIRDTPVDGLSLELGTYEITLVIERSNQNSRTECCKGV